MKRRTLALLLSVALCMGMLTACNTGGSTGEDQAPTESANVVEPSTKLNKPPKEDQILSDANATKYIERPAPFTACEVIKRQSNPEKKEDIVYVRLMTDQSHIRAEQQYRLLYNYYDEGGWILDEATPENEDEWTVAYLDAAGNDFWDDVVWLDAFSPGVLSEAADVDCWITADGKGFVYTNGAAITTMGAVQGYTQRLEQGIYSADMTMFFPTYVDKTSESYPINPVRNVFVASDGTYRVIAQEINGNQGCCLYDWDGRVLADYNYIIWHEDGFCAVEDENGNYGAIDENGNVLQPVKYSSYEEIVAEVGHPASQIPEHTKVDFQGDMGDTIFYTNWNGVFCTKGPAIPGGDYSQRLVNASGAEILPQIEGSQAEGDRGLVAVFSRYDYVSHEACRPGYFRFYDLDGNCRSPELHMACNVMTNAPGIIEKDGRYGILPKMATAEEGRYYRFLWGMGHQS